MFMHKIMIFLKIGTIKILFILRNNHLPNITNAKIKDNDTEIDKKNIHKIDIYLREKKNKYKTHKIDPNQTTNNPVNIFYFRKVDI